MARWSESSERSLSTIYNNEMFRKRFAFDFARFRQTFSSLKVSIFFVRFHVKAPQSYF